ncbi:cytochrome c oxidase cbb3-type subunit 4 [Tamilnaduibacter salinus]|uniref:CcoQ/FixQ family Cbb3-type cytochrome c oxidase assembly chaperone n=1 Tax=Tamilnaduibacter salinus TaxID=1484056 RepID=A0A2A2I521_9GAMM|nr:cbb3-type cytochrome c oxidase subunit 3 [Tamilnaduibacter salinus]PAV26757.1 CcoQ/FixQ family Cbb3-type cytochrome c oxidase assembly chaperone [Tamilnaduibacter salinus]PVY75369.1 cytochrome c oxidase cbb3-type subunit 4 [Tamilnaduibacter salinus]
MDLNDVRGIHTLLVMVAFLGIVWWAYSAKRRKPNDEAANLPFEDDDIDQRTRRKENTENDQ